MLQLKAEILQHSISIMNLKDETLYTLSPKRPRSRCIPEDLISVISITLHDNSDKKESNDKKEQKKQNQQVRKCTLHFKIKKMSTDSPRDDNSVLDTINHY